MCSSPTVNSNTEFNLIDIDMFPMIHSVLLVLLVCVTSVSGQPKFDLVAGFPPKPLTDPSLTLKEAGLLGASVQQRL